MEGDTMSLDRGTSQGSRFETFTEAVPLSLSSMAHANIPLDEGILDGLKQVLSHTMLSCVNYARIVHPPHQWTFRDLCTSPQAWAAFKGEENPKDLPFSLEKMNFKYQYSRNALIYLKPALPKDLTAEQENDLVDDWRHKPGILGRISLLYISTEPLTPEEMNGTEVDDMPPCMLYKAVVEYRSLPASGKQQPVLAEELSMLSFGGSVDDDVKYGALASLYDENAKYVLEIYSVRGKKYKFDLMDSTLSDGTVPHLPSSMEGDPFAKCLCVTVSNHDLNKDESNDRYAITRMHLSMEGKPRQGNVFNNLPEFDFLSSSLEANFLSLCTKTRASVSATPSGHTLLLDPEMAGHIFVNGRFVTTWGEDVRIGSHGVALFGMDLHSIPCWHGRIVDFEALKEAYALLWHELLVDARVVHLNLGRKLLFRLMKGKEPKEEPANDFEYDDDDEVDVDDNINVNVDCLESQVLGSLDYDRVGIAAKALATRFAIEFGEHAFPCLAHETKWVKKELPGKEPVVVPRRVIDVLRRGGYFNIQQTSDIFWFTASRPVKKGIESEIVAEAVRLLERAECTFADTQNIVIVSSPVHFNVINADSVCRWNEETEQIYVHESFMDANVEEYMDDTVDVKDPTRIKAYLLGMFIAKSHPYGKTLSKYLVRCRP